MREPTTAAVEEVALLPCPFCGSEAEIERRGDHRVSTIYQCTFCGCSLETGEEWSHGRDWNNRAAILALPSVGWRTIDSAPKDGTRILIWFVHANAAYSKDPVTEGWEAAHEAYWTDHNGGGWTWYGLCGVAKYWQPLPSPPQPVEDRP